MAAADAPTTTSAPGSGSGLDRFFHLTARGTTARIEAIGGASTFLTMSYILFVNPAILSAAGIPFEAVAVATAISAAIATAVMAFATNLPFALAPGLGINAIVAFDLVLGRGLEWPVAMSAIVVEGVFAFVLVLFGLREAIMRAVPYSLKLAIGVGIGVFIALVGLREGGIVVNDPATGIGLGDLSTGPPLVALGGLGVAIVLAVRGVRGAVLGGMATAVVLGLVFGVLEGPDGVARIPAGTDFDTIGQALDPANIADVLTVALLPIIFALFMTDFFDTVGTAVAVGRSGGLTDAEGQLPRTRQLLLVDSAAAAGGGIMGCSSVTTYVESGAGVAEGARTGLSSLVVAVGFILAIFFVPVISLVGQGVALGDDVIGHPAVAPALIMIGYLMIRLVGEIDWARPEDALPAFLVIVGIPVTYEISAGIGFGFIGYVLVMVARGRTREVHGLMWLAAAAFVVFFAADWLSRTL